MSKEEIKAEADKVIVERYEKVDATEHYATMRVLKVLMGSVRGRELVERIIEFDIEHGYCDFPKSCVLDFWGRHTEHKFEVKSDASYFGYWTVFVKGEKMGFEENPYYLNGATAEEVKWLEDSLNELTMILNTIEEGK